MSQQDIERLEEPGGRPAHLEGKVSTFDFTMVLVHMYSDLEACCQLIQINLHEPEKLAVVIQATKDTVRKQQKEMEKLLAMDIDTTLELDTWQLGKRP